MNRNQDRLHVSLRSEVGAHKARSLSGQVINDLTGVCRHLVKLGWDVHCSVCRCGCGDLSQVWTVDNNGVVHWL